MSIRRKIIPLQCNGFSILKICLPAGSSVKFSMDDEDISLGAYYDGVLTISEADDSSWIGHQFTGFVDFSLPEHAQFNQRNHKHTCVAEADITWYCIHSDDVNVIRPIDIVMPNESKIIPAGTTAIVLPVMYFVGPEIFERIVEPDSPVLLIGEAAQ